MWIFIIFHWHRWLVVVFAVIIFAYQITRGVGINMNPHFGWLDGRDEKWWKISLGPCRRNHQQPREKWNFSERFHFSFHHWMEIKIDCCSMCWKMKFIHQNFWCLLSYSQFQAQVVEICSLLFRNLNIVKRRVILFFMNLFLYFIKIDEFLRFINMFQFYRLRIYHRMASKKRVEFFLCIHTNKTQILEQNAKRRKKFQLVKKTIRIVQTMQEMFNPTTKSSKERIYRSKIPRATVTTEKCNLLCFSLPFISSFSFYHSHPPTRVVRV